MKITIVQGGSLPIPPFRGGAIEKVWFNLGKEFAKKGHTVTHISRTFEGLPDDQWLEGVHHVRVKGLRLSNKRHVVIWRDLQYALRALCKLPEANIVVTNTPVLPILIRTHRFGALYVHMGRYPKGQARFYRHAARLQTASRAAAHAIIRQNPESADKVSIVPYPLAVTAPNLDLAGSWPKRRKEILYVGRLHPEKGIHDLIDAFKLMVQCGIADWRLTLVGPWDTAEGGGGEAYYRLLRTKSASIADRMKFVGPIFDHEVLTSYYRRARLFVYPSLAEQGESFGLAPLEAMAGGCPPLVSSLECFRDYLENGRSGFVFNHRSSNPAYELFCALRKIVSSDQKLRAVAVRGYEVARAYEPSNVAEIYLQDFAAAVEHRCV